MGARSFHGHVVKPQKVSVQLFMIFGCPEGERHDVAVSHRCSVIRVQCSVYAVGANEEWRTTNRRLGRLAQILYLGKG